jgi:photosystem II stability/assembly factor-like uncharacterized protein
MAGKVVIIILVVLLGIIIVTPFVLIIAGVNIFELGSVAGGPQTGEAVIMRSLDGGTKWEDVSISGNKKISFPREILSLAFHPQNADTIYLGAKSSGLWRSTAGGAFWEKVTDTSKIIDPRSDVYKIGISRSNPDVMYIAIYQDNRGRVYRSDDGGASFREVYFATSNRFVVFDLFVDPINSNHVLMATGQGGLLETKDGGRTWRVVKWFTEAVEKLAVNPLDPQEIFVVTASDNLFKSVDGGENFAELRPEVRSTEEQGIIPTAPRPNPFGGVLGTRDRISAFLFDPSSPLTLYMGSVQGLLRSNDSGFNWERLNLLIPPEDLPVSALNVHPRSSQVIFAGAGTQLHQSTDGGVSWSFAALPVSTRIKSLAISSLEPQLMFMTFGR